LRDIYKFIFLSEQYSSLWDRLTNPLKFSWLFYTDKRKERLCHHSALALRIDQSIDVNWSSDIAVRIFLSGNRDLSRPFDWNDIRLLGAACIVTTPDFHNYASQFEATVDYNLRGPSLDWRIYRSIGHVEKSYNRCQSSLLMMLLIDRQCTGIRKKWFCWNM